MTAVLRRDREHRCAPIGYPVHYVSAKQGIGIEALRERLAGRVSIVSGPSGVGKSTLLNALQPGLRLQRLPAPGRAALRGAQRPR